MNPRRSFVILDVDGVFPPNNQTDTFYQFLDSKLNHVFPLFEYHDLWKLMFRSKTAKASLLQPNPSKGYLYSRADVPFSGHRPHAGYNAVVDQIINQTLDEFYSLCKENNIKLVLVYVPTAYSWNQERHDWMEEYATTHDVPFFDLNSYPNRFQIDWKKDTRDGGTHLNFSGAKRVTLYLGDYLHQHYTLPDHRADPAFSQWDKSYEAYLKMATPKPAVKLSKSIRQKG